MSKNKEHIPAGSHLSDWMLVLCYLNSNREYESLLTWLFSFWKNCCFLMFYNKLSRPNHKPFSFAYFILIYFVIFQGVRKRRKEKRTPILDPSASIVFTWTRCSSSPLSKELTKYLHERLVYCWPLVIFRGDLNILVTYSSESSINL